MTPEEELEFLRSRVNELETKELDHADLAFHYNLPPMLEKIFRLLMSQSRMTSEQLAARLPQGAMPKFVICRLRKTLKPHGVEIQSKRHMGYWITDADKKKVIERARSNPLSKKIA